ncbi:hypothetical protein FB45DRAFT_754932 [Roridomyces roridus]|uniref:Fe2OG dioxygenase domain-containing protein n=1 Tax=Roridomyces roridus TaxID=1738132 RepID=A0AAD7BFW5_9AGAR|nr:hypothetical protein FB45DRAFT_754932 [Roridomyces roridus]
MTASDEPPDSPNSLFDEIVIDSAVLSAPPIPGLFFSPDLLLPREMADDVFRFCIQEYFHHQSVNQIMLFGVASDPSSGLPPQLITLLSTMSDLLQPSLPPDVHALLFPKHPSAARQAIVNLYHPGEGITPHVDLLSRFGDGIIGVSLGCSCVMDFAPVNQEAESPVSLFLPERTMIVLSGDARYKWTHGIQKRMTDRVADRIVERGVRVSITFRWLLPGADVVGE